MAPRVEPTGRAAARQLQQARRPLGIVGDALGPLDVHRHPVEAVAQRVEVGDGAQVVEVAAHVAEPGHVPPDHPQAPLVCARTRKLAATPGSSRPAGPVPSSRAGCRYSVRTPTAAMASTSATVTGGRPRPPLIPRPSPTS
jgi:hypothetical protein